MTAAPSGTVAGFMASAPAAPPRSGNTEWAHRYADEVRRVFKAHAAAAPRSLQTRLGPSEIGVECDRQVVGKLAGLPATNHVMDPWPSIRGTALHTWAEAALLSDNDRSGRVRWHAERRVTPFPVRDHHEGHRGTADAYDTDQQAVVDWKFLGPTSMNKLRRHGPPAHYRSQLKLYGLGYAREGAAVSRVVLVAVPATESSLDGVHVWEHVLGPADLDELAEVERRLEARKTTAAAVVAGHLPIEQVATSPDDGVCIFCPFLRPQARHGGPGCPGHTAAAS